MRVSRLIATFLVGILLLSGCASTPSWKGMSEDQIAAWRALDIEAAEAQAYRKAGIDTGDVEDWREAGLSAGDAILAWHEAGWTPAMAAPWLNKQFGLELATEWSGEKFTADQAREWIDAGFSLREAIANRSKGLAPVR
jgi:hypothetical protein